MTRPECDCRAKEHHPLHVIAKMPDGEWHEPMCAVAEYWRQIILESRKGFRGGKGAKKK